MQLLSILMPLIGLVCTVAFIWLVVVAFKHSTVWGVLVLLFSPITAIVFAVKNWEESKKPFLAYIGSSVAGFAVVVMFIISLGAPMVQMAHQMSEGEVSQQEAAAFMEQHIDRMDDAGLLDDADRDELARMKGMLHEMQQDEAPAPEPAPLTAALATADALDRSRTPAGAAAAVVADPVGPTSRAATRASRTRDVIPLWEVGSYVGEKLRVVRNNGTQIEGRLGGETDDALRFERRISAGTIDIHVSKQQIRSIHMIQD